MASTSPSWVWFMRLAFVLLGLGALVFHLLPLITIPGRMAPPDLMMGFTFAWVLRRPEYAPVVLIALLWFLSDLLLMRPPGLMTVLVILGSEYLVTRAGGMRDASFLGEWFAVTLTVVAITILYRTTLWLFAVDQAQLSLSVIQAGLTIAAYPVIACFTHYVLRVRKLAPGDSDAIGGRA